MIGLIDGRVIAVSDDVVTLLTSSGVGYEVRINATTAARLQEDSVVRLWIHTALREQAFELFGFTARGERDLFRLLLKVPQIGTRTAQTMLGVFEAPTLMRLVSNGNVDALTTIPGIGKKTAQRIVVELKDLLGAMVPAAATEALTAPAVEAVQALVGLGYAAYEARHLVQVALERGHDAADLEGLIRAVLTEAA